MQAVILMLYIMANCIMANKSYSESDKRLHRVFVALAIIGIFVLFFELSRSLYSSNEVVNEFIENYTNNMSGRIIINEKITYIIKSINLDIIKIIAAFCVTEMYLVIAHFYGKENKEVIKLSVICITLIGYLIIAFRLYTVNPNFSSITYSISVLLVCLVITVLKITGKWIKSKFVK